MKNFIMQIYSFIYFQNWDIFVCFAIHLITMVMAE